MQSPDTPQAGHVIEIAAPGTEFPGHSIDTLRTQGKAVEARAEFERLLQEGVDSGVDPRTPAAILDSVRTEIRNRVMLETGETAGPEA